MIGSESEHGAAAYGLQPPQSLIVGLRMMMKHIQNMLLVLVLLSCFGCTSEPVADQNPVVQKRTDRMSGMSATLHAMLESRSAGSPYEWVVQPGGRDSIRIIERLGKSGYSDFCDNRTQSVVDAWENRLWFGYANGKAFILSGGPDGDWRTIEDNLPRGTLDPEVVRLLNTEMKQSPAR